MKRILILSLTIILSLSVSAKKLQQYINHFATDSTLMHASVGICVYSLSEGKEIAGFNSAISDIPASTMKTLSCATALDNLGENFTFDTRVILVGDTDESSSYHGKLVIKASGDPTLGSKYFKNAPNFISQIIAKLKRLGVSELSGIEITPKQRETEGGSINWTIDDLAYDYGAGAYTFNYADNAFALPINITESTIEVGETSPHIPGLFVENQCILSDANEDYVLSTPDIIRGINSDRLILTGVVKKNGGKKILDCATPNPRTFFMQELTTELAKNGIKITDKPLKSYNDTIKLLRYSSPKLRDIIKSTLWRSDNMFTQAMLTKTAQKEYGIWECNAATTFARNYWKGQGLNVNQLFMSDASGLARSNKVSALFLTQMLAKAQANSIGREYPYSLLLPLAGTPGSGHDRIGESPYSGQVALKSGSMSGVQCYTGYYPAVNPKFTIAILVNNFNGSRDVLNDRIDDLIISLIPEMNKIASKR